MEQKGIESKGNELNKEFLLIFIPQLIVNFNLDEVFFKDPFKTIEEVISLFRKNYPSDLEINCSFILTPNNFEEESNKFRNHLLKLEEITFKQFKAMYLSQAVLIFEGMINTFYSQELVESKCIKIKTVNDKILNKVGIKDKLSWFLKILCGSDFTSEKPNVWKEIIKIIKLRNYLVHSKPNSLGRVESFENGIIIDKELIFNFLDNSLICYKFLSKIRSKELKQLDERIKKVTDFYSNLS